MQEVKRLVLRHKMAYIGVCGGAKMAGSLPFHGLPGLGLLGEVTVTYSCNSSSTIPTQAGVQELHITSGVAVALVIWQGTYAVKAFPVIKNARQWWDFCEKSDNIYSTAVMSWAAEYMCFLDDHGEMRWHSVAGMVHRDGEWQLCLPAATA